jgi:hypothetical protein
VDQYPVPGTGGRAIDIEQTDIHCPSHARNFDSGKPVLLVDHLDQQSWNR